MPINKLILMPRDPRTSLANSAPLQQALSACGLVDEAVTHKGMQFYPTGEHFLQLVSFLGCSPAIELDPPADPAQLDHALETASFCYLRLQCLGNMTFRADPVTRPPRCPGCRKPDGNWQSTIQAWLRQPDQTHWRCPACQHDCEVAELDFRKSAGFGQLFVEINGIYPSEAVPCDALLNTLSQITAGPWHYIYIKE